MPINKLVQAIRRQDWHTANENFAQAMQSRLADRLAIEKRIVANNALNEAAHALGTLVRCKKCNAWVDLAFGADEPAAHQDAAGTKDDPRSPGDHDDICDACDYGGEGNWFPGTVGTHFAGKRLREDIINYNQNDADDFEPQSKGRIASRQCALCRCHRTGYLYGYSVCDYHKTHGEDDPPCPKCSLKEATIPAFEVQRVFDEIGDVEETELLCGVTGLRVNENGSVVSYVTEGVQVRMYDFEHPDAEGKFRDIVAKCPKCNYVYPLEALHGVSHMGGVQCPDCGVDVKTTGKYGTFQWNDEQNIATYLGD